MRQIGINMTEAMERTERPAMAFVVRPVIAVDPAADDARFS
jgi:hypothetical protein